jgi:[acyl-carrier-protein] S-malonyltransferase
MSDEAIRAPGSATASPTGAEQAMQETKSRTRNGRWRNWTSGWLTNRGVSELSRSDRLAVAAPGRAVMHQVGVAGQREITRADLKQQIATAALAFRGYDASNLGRSPELLEHPVYEPIVRGFLDRASVLCGEILKAKVDLAQRVLAREPATLGSFVEDTATIVAMELAQIQLLEQVFEVPVGDATLSFGHSIGELSALVLGKVYEMEQLLPVPLSLAHDCADLAADTTMGILSSPSSVLDADDVQKLCSAISSRGHGLVGASTYLSPYQVLLLGQRDTLDLLEEEMRHYLPAAVTLRRRSNHWPPLHTPLVWERSVPNRAAVALYRIEGGRSRPKPTVISCTTGKANYDEWNSREILTQWTDHPQRLWEVMENTLASGVELVIHVGPEPKLIPTAFERLSGRIMKQLKSTHLDRLGRRVLPSISRSHWLARTLPLNAVLFRAPFVRHMILEDWLLAQDAA